MVISRAVVGKKIFGRQTDGVQALWKRLYPWTDYGAWARLSLIHGHLPVVHKTWSRSRFFGPGDF